MSTATSLRDHPAGYGIVSRAFHWIMAAFILWQFVSVLLRLVAEDTAVEGFFWGTHYSVGFTIWVLAILRGIWGLSNLSNRPSHEGPALLAKGATLGHFLLYALMIVVPTLAILRAAGNGRGFSVYGLQLVAPGGEPNPALTAPGNAAHGLLGFVLFVLIAGHIVFALWHAFSRRDGTLDRMTKGRSDKAPALRA